MRWLRWILSTTYERFPRWNPARETDLLQAHEVLMAGLLDAPGHYRRSGVRVVGSGRVHHVGPPAARVPGLMADLLAWLGAAGEHPLIASSVFPTSSSSSIRSRTATAAWVGCGRR